MKFNDTFGIAAFLAVLVLAGAMYFTARRQTQPLRTWRSQAHFLRLLLVALLTLTLSQPYFEFSRKKSNLLPTLQDISESVEEQTGEELIRALSGLGFDLQNLEAVPFAKDSARFGAPLRGGSFRSARLAWSRLDIGNTNLESALGYPLYAGEKQVLLLSDGHETSGDVFRILPQLKLEGVRVFPVLPEHLEGSRRSLRITDFHAPLLAASGKSVELRAAIQNGSEKPQLGRLTLTQGGKIIHDEELTVAPGTETVLIKTSEPIQEGTQELTVLITPADSAMAPSSKTLFVSGELKEKVLMFSGLPEDERNLREVLKTQSYQFESIISNGQRLAGIPDLKLYTAVILNNIKFDDLPAGCAEKLEGYVRDGGGLLMLGGNNSFGLGGYRNTPVEKALPVELLPPQKEQKRLNLAVQLVLDKSGSMQEDQKMDFLQVAAKELIGGLKDEDYLGMIVFDNTPWVLLDIGELSRVRQKAIERLKLIFPKGQTVMLPAMDVGRQQLERAQAGRKHMIILTDGQVPNAERESSFYEAMVKEMRLSGITVSTFMLGSDTDFILQTIAELGGGAFHRTRDPRSLPRLFLEDLKVVVGEKTQREDQEYRVAPGDGQVESTGLSSFPEVLGYVQTKRKSGANLELVAMAAGKAEPLLVSWSYGKGRAAAFTSDVSGRWSYHWIRWPKFYQFWSDILDSFREEQDSPGNLNNFDLRYLVNKGVLELDLSVFSEALAAGFSAKLKTPDGKERPVDFSKLSPGHFQAQLPGALAGKYELVLSNNVRPLATVAFYLAGDLFGEKKGLGINTRLLEKLALETGGKVNPSAAELAQVSTAKKVKVSLVPFLLLAALALLIWDILKREGVKPAELWRIFKR